MPYRNSFLETSRPQQQAIASVIPPMPVLYRQPLRLANSHGRSRTCCSDEVCSLPRRPTALRGGCVDARMEVGFFVAWGIGRSRIEVPNPRHRDFWAMLWRVDIFSTLQATQGAWICRTEKNIIPLGDFGFDQVESQVGIWKIKIKNKQ